MDEKELPQENGRKEINLEFWRLMLSAGTSIKEWGIGIGISDYSEEDWTFHAYAIDLHFLCFWAQITFN